MQKSNKMKVKHEIPSTSQSSHRTKGRDLTQYVDDRVELLHQAFSLLKPKEIRAIMPDCVKNINLDVLKELCLEELLGISSKRLSATLDGTAPPSDTETSNESDHAPDNLDAISLENISSDEGVLSQQSSSETNRKHKHCKRRGHKHKEKSKEQAKTKSTKSDDNIHTAERAGLTVLELLELQARARAIRAQLLAEQKKNNAGAELAAALLSHSDNDEVEIKEEPPEVVELISSEDEMRDQKPDVTQLQKQIVDIKLKKETQDTPAQETTQTIIKRNDLTIIVPKTSTTKKFKLIRPKPPTAVVNEQSNKQFTKSSGNTTHTKNYNDQSDQANENLNNVINKNNVPKESNNEKEQLKHDKKKIKKHKNKKKKPKRRNTDTEDGSDHDEIHLQLSDSEKMDLLEDLDRKGPVITRSDSESTSSTVEESDDDAENNQITDEIQLTTTNEREKDVENATVYSDSELNIEKIEKSIESYNKINENNDERVSFEEKDEKNAILKLHTSKVRDEETSSSCENIEKTIICENTECVSLPHNDDINDVSTATKIRDSQFNDNSQTNNKTSSIDSDKLEVIEKCDTGLPPERNQVRCQSQKKKKSKKKKSSKRP